MVYLSWYRTHEDPFYCVPPPLGPIEYSSNSDMSTDEIQYSQHWELERVVDHHTRRDGTTRYLVRWKGYGSREDSWKSVGQLKYAKRLLAEYEERRRRVEEIGGMRPCRQRKPDRKV